jgi:hypothetical protein
MRPSACAAGNGLSEQIKKKHVIFVNGKRPMTAVLITGANRGLGFEFASTWLTDATYLPRAATLQVPASLALDMVSYIRSICARETLSEYVVFACDDSQATVTQPIPSLSSPQMPAAGAFALSSKAPTARSFLLKLRRSSPPTKLTENSGQTY